MIHWRQLFGGNLNNHNYHNSNNNNSNSIKVKIRLENYEQRHHVHNSTYFFSMISKAGIVYLKGWFVFLSEALCGGTVCLAILPCIPCQFYILKKVEKILSQEHT